jgi:hypothetical protein
MVGKPNYKNFVIFFKEKKICTPSVLKYKRILADVSDLDLLEMRIGPVQPDENAVAVVGLFASPSSPLSSLHSRTRRQEERRWSARHGRLRPPPASRSVAPALRAPSKNSNQDSVWNLLVARVAAVRVVRRY